MTVRDIQLWEIIVVVFSLHAHSIARFTWSKIIWIAIWIMIQIILLHVKRVIRYLKDTGVLAVSILSRNAIKCPYTVVNHHEISSTVLSVFLHCCYQFYVHIMWMNKSKK